MLMGQNTQADSVGLDQTASDQTPYISPFGQR